MKKYLTQKVKKEVLSLHSIYQKNYLNKNNFITKMLIVGLALFSTIGLQLQAQVFVASGGSGDGSSWDSPMGSLKAAMNKTSAAQGGVITVYVKEGIYSEDMENPANADIAPSNLPDGYNVVVQGGMDAYLTGTETCAPNGYGYDPQSNKTILDGRAGGDTGETWFRVDEGDGNLTVRGFEIWGATNDGAVGTIANIENKDNGIFIFEDIFVKEGNTTANLDGQFMFDNSDGNTITFNNINAKLNEGGNSLLRLNPSSNGNTITFTNSSVSDYNAGVPGAAMHIESDVGQLPNIITVTNSSFCNNNAGSGLDGGAITIKNGSATLTNCEFASNYAYGSGKGGAITLTEGSYMVTNNCRFEDNKAKGGGAVLIYDSTWESNNDVFIENIAHHISEGHGGAILMEANSTVTITGAHFQGNRANGTVAYGGAIRPVYSALKLVSCST